MRRFSIFSNTAEDRRSGLMWSRDAALSQYPLSWMEAFAFVAGLNVSKWGGFNDWRLPNRRELFSLISHNQINPALPSGHPFVNVFPGYYWTSSTVCRLPDQAWYVHLGGARMVKGMKSGSYMVWPVRGPDGNSHVIQAGLAWPEPRFELIGESAVDRLTNLAWNRCADQFGRPVTWQEANQITREVNASQFEGFSDWRLPHIRELESLCDMQNHSPALPFGHPFENVRSFYWSATTSRYDPTYAWALYLTDGNVGVGFKTKAEFFVWLVRSAGPAYSRD